MLNKTINGYIIKHFLAEGGQANVWYAENVSGNSAAIKILKREFCANEILMSRFINEARMMERLIHPNIRKIYGYGKAEGCPYIVMEYLEGKDMKKRMLDGETFSDRQLRQWWGQLVDALNYSHKQGVIHRDIKPANIFITRQGNAKLIDFGIAKVQGYGDLTKTGQEIGTPIYMSPEQVRAPKRVTEATDAYSLAVTFVHLLTGKVPYDSDVTSFFDIQMAIVHDPLDMAEVPLEWRTFLQQYLTKDSQKRPMLRPSVDCVNKEHAIAKRIECVKSQVSEDITMVEKSADDKTVVEEKVINHPIDTKVNGRASNIDIKQSNSKRKSYGVRNRLCLVWYIFKCIIASCLATAMAVLILGVIFDMFNINLYGWIEIVIIILLFIVCFIINLIELDW